MLSGGESPKVTTHCKGIINPVTGECLEKTRPILESREPKTELLGPAPNFNKTDYQYGTYCNWMGWLNEQKMLVNLGTAYDVLFDSVAKINDLTVDPLAKTIGFKDTFWLATTATYSQSVFKNLRGIPYADLISTKGRSALMTPITRALTTEAWKGSTPFQLAAATQIAFSGVFRGADEVIDNIPGGRNLSGLPRAGAYWGTSIAETGGALAFLGMSYGSRLGGGPRLSNVATAAWVGWWTAYSAYFYNHVDQREYLRWQGKDPSLADNPLHWSWDAYNTNRFVSDWASNELGTSVLWAVGPKAGRMLADKTFGFLGYNEERKFVDAAGQEFIKKRANFFETWLPFSAAEKTALRTAAERASLGTSTLWEDIAGLKVARWIERTGLNIKWLGRATLTTLTPPSPFKWYVPFRWAYVGLQSLYTILVSSMPLSRIVQMSRKITEDDQSKSKPTGSNACTATSSSTIRGVSVRGAISNILNTLVMGPMRWAGVPVSMFGFYAPGMLLNVYPYNSCNEIPTSFHQVSLLHLERFRQATTEEGKAKERALFYAFFVLSNPEDQKKDIEKYTDPSYPEEVRTLYAKADAQLKAGQASAVPPRAEFIQGISEAIHAANVPALEGMDAKAIASTIESLTPEDLIEAQQLQKQNAPSQTPVRQRWDLSKDPWVGKKMDPSKG